MILWLLLGGGCLFLLLGAGEGFSRANVTTIKSLLAWTAALAGLTLGTLMLLTGRGAGAIGALVMFGPLAWSWWKESQGKGKRPGARPDARPGARSGARWGRAVGPRMSRDEALAVLGLKSGATEAEIRAAYLRLMRTAHPDQGGSDWIATRINQARDTLLRG
jgi:DnaJ family protein C protein 19